MRKQIYITSFPKSIYIFSFKSPLQVKFPSEIIYFKMPIYSFIHMDFFIFYNSSSRFLFNSLR